jgi:hypothetical protein
MKVIRSISAVVLALLVLVSSTSFMIGVHFCMGKVQNVAFLTKAESCAMEQNLPPCHRHQKAPCCADETIVHKADDFKGSVVHFNLSAPAPIYIEQPMIFISEIVPSSAVSQFHYFNYDPPLRSCDLTVEHQVFLI